jgi:hypothetical protein
MNCTILKFKVSLKNMAHTSNNSSVSRGIAAHIPIRDVAEHRFLDFFEFVQHGLARKN